MVQQVVPRRNPRKHLAYFPGSFLLVHCAFWFCSLRKCYSLTHYSCPSPLPVLARIFPSIVARSTLFAHPLPHKTSPSRSLATTRTAVSPRVLSCPCASPPPTVPAQVAAIPAAARSSESAKPSAPLHPLAFPLFHVPATPRTSFPRRSLRHADISCISSPSPTRVRTYAQNS